MKKILIIMLSFFIFAPCVHAAKIDISAKHQQLDVDKNKGLFSGDVQVQIGDIIVKSPSAKLDLDPKTKKPSLATFLENPYAFQEKGSKKHEIKSQIIKVSLLNKKLYASGNTQSIIMQDRQPVVVVTSDTQEYDTNTKIMKAQGGVVITYDTLETYSEYAEAKIDNGGEIDNLKLRGNVVIKEKGNIVKGNNFDYDMKKGDFVISGNTTSDVVFEDGTRVYTIADRQIFNRYTKSLIAAGHVTIEYKDYIAKGPKAHLLVDEKTNKANEVIFTGRSKITEKGNSIEADRIKLILNPKGFTADGNVKTSINTEDSGDMEL
ncbi:hypothetical protein IJC60_00390 [bacterium]|nr:hypothetical protein [bacterium]